MGLATNFAKNAFFGALHFFSRFLSVFNRLSARNYLNNEENEETLFFSPFSLFLRFLFIYDVEVDVYRVILNAVSNKHTYN